MGKLRAYFSISAFLLAHIAVSSPAGAASLVADLRGNLDGSCNGFVFTTPTGQFSAGDVGKVLVISGDANGTARAGTQPIDNAPLFTTIATVTSANAVTMADACASTMTGITAAQWHLGTDNTAALQECLNGGECVVAAGQYLMSGAPPSMQAPPVTIPYDSRVYPPSNSKLLCQAGAVFLFPHHDNDGTNRSFLDLKGVQNVTISGCTVRGTNLHRAFTEGAQGNYAIVIHGVDGSGAPAMNNSTVNNTIRNGWSDGDITLNNYFNGDAPGVPLNNLISGNLISNCGLNGITIVSGRGNIIQNNNLSDCNIDIEPNDENNGPVFANLVRGNTVTKLLRPGIEAIETGYMDDALGRHYVLFFSSCARASCDITGGDSIAVLGNTFVGGVEILPYCRGGRVAQTWTANVTKNASGAVCTLNAPGCGYTPAYSCAPAPGSNVNYNVLNIINSLLLN